MFVKQEQNTLVIIQYIACGGEPEHQESDQGQSVPKLKAHIVGHLHGSLMEKNFLLKFICREDKHYWVHLNSKLHPF